MKVIKIKSVIAEGFRSLSERVEVNLDRQGLNLVKGVNGAGKTTLFEVIVYCLYGTNLKGTTADMIPTWEEVRTEAFRGTFTEVILDIDGEEYRIVRTIGWSGGEGIGRDALVIRGQDKAGVHKKDVQAQIVNLLGVDSQTFMSSILFGQRMPKLVETDNKDKRDLFERLFETAFINDAKAKASDAIHELIGQEAEAVTEANKLSMEHDGVCLAMDEQVRLVSEFELHQEKKREGIEASIATTKKEIGYNDEELGRKQKEVDAWDDGKYQLFKKDLDELEKTFNAMEAKAEIPAKAYEDAQTRLGKASKADVLAETNIKVEKERIEHAVTRKAGDIVLLKEELQELMNKKARKLNEVEDICYACNQALPPESVEDVRKSIEKTYDPQLDNINIRLGNKQAEELPVSNLPELEKIQKATIKELDSAAKAKQEALETYEQFQKDNVDTKDQFEAMVEEEKGLDQKAMGITEHKNRITSLQNSTSILNESVKNNENQITALMKETGPTFEKTIDELKEDEQVIIGLKDAAQEKVDDLNNQMDLHNWWKSKGFAAAGLPSFVFKAMLDNLNEYVQQYSARLGVSIEFSIDLTKASKPFTTICSVGTRMNKDYKEFSGGQKQRLDIVLIFAMHDLVSADADINVMIMDEVFEGLDEAGEAAVFDLVRMKADEGKSIYIITHSPHIDSLYSSTITAIADETGATKIAA